MSAQPWKNEWLLLCGVGILALLLWLLSGSWQLSLAVGGAGYVVLMWYRLLKLRRWLKAGMPEDKMPIAGGILGDIINLIYQHHKVIENASKAQQTLNRQFHETISAIPSATIVLNKDSEIEWANDSALALLGINGHRDIGIKIKYLIRQEHFLSRLYKGNSEQFEIQSPVSPNLTLAVQVVRCAEQRRLLIAHNITPHIEVQRSRKLFIANASHELRTPLTVVAGYLEFMQSDPALPDNFKRPVGKAIEQVDNMEMLINDLLTLSRLEDKKLKKKNLNLINLKDHSDVILQTLEAGGKTHGHTIHYCVETAQSIEANEKELNSVCYNLINNAVKYSEAGSEITVRWERLSDDYVKFSVTDQGIGIAPEHITHLTERFYRVDSGRSKRVGGTGLGLSIVKHILERHHGRLEIHSRIGEGSTFSAILPTHPLH